MSDSHSASKRKRFSVGAESSGDESMASTSSHPKSKHKSKHRSSDRDSSDKKSSSKSKHRSSASDDAGTSASEAESEASSAPSSSSSKKKKSSRKSSKSSSAASSLLSQPLASAFELQYLIVTLSIPPIHASQPMTALVETFDSLVMRFVPPLNGVLVSHGSAFFLDQSPGAREARAAQGSATAPPPSALIDADGAWAKNSAAVECCVWRPKIGMKIEGTISLSTPSHVSLLIHSTFNASISSSHMTDYEYVDVHDEPTADGGEGDEAMGQDTAGYWRHKGTKERIGAADGGRVQFIVIGLTVSGHTLSVSGSLLSQPFSVPPPHGSTSLSYAMGESGSRVQFASGTNDDAEQQAIRRATRRVRWEGEESDTEVETEAEATDAEDSSRSLKGARSSWAGKSSKPKAGSAFAPRAPIVPAGTGKHVKF